MKLLVQARLEAERFPNKVLHGILGQPMLLWQLDRLAQKFDRRDIFVLVANTPESRGELLPLIHKHGYGAVCPPVKPADVLGRFLDATVQLAERRFIVRLTGDCPLIDPQVVFDLIQFHTQHTYSFSALAPEWPDGLDCEVIDVQALTWAARVADQDYQLEHVTPVLWEAGKLAAGSQNGGGVRIPQGVMRCPLDLSDHCWSVDTPEDLEMVRKLVWEQAPRGFDFGWRDVWLQIEQTPELLNWATGRRRNSAYLEQTGAASWKEARYGTVS